MVRVALVKMIKLVWMIRNKLQVNGEGSDVVAWGWHHM